MCALDEVVVDVFVVVVDGDGVISCVCMNLCVCVCVLRLVSANRRHDLGARWGSRDSRCATSERARARTVLC